MGCWGMGLTQSDEFCEVYDKFMQAYDDGQAVSDITEKLLGEYRREFDDADGVMHDVCFALAKAEWMCCEQSAKILSRVKDIIEKDLNIIYYRELCATESDLKVRKRNLHNFWISLQTPKKSARKRVAPPRKSECAVLEKGTLFWYKRKSKYFAAAVLDIVDNSFFVALSNEMNVMPKSADDLLNAEARMASWFTVLIPQSQIHIIDKIELEQSYNGRAGMYFDADLDIHFCENCGLDEYWEGLNDYKNRWTYSNLKLKDMLLAENVPVKFVMEEQLKRLIEQKKRGRA